MNTAQRQHSSRHGKGFKKQMHILFGGEPADVQKDEGRFASVCRPHAIVAALRPEHFRIDAPPPNRCRPNSHSNQVLTGGRPRGGPHPPATAETTPGPVSPS